MRDGMSRRRFIRILGFSCLSGGIAGCATAGIESATPTGSRSATPTSVPRPTATRSRVSPTEPARRTSTTDGATGAVRFAHASPRTGAVDVLVDGDSAVSRLPFGTVGTYGDLRTGERPFVVTVSGDGEELVRGSLVVRPGPHTVALIPAGPGIRPFTLDDGGDPPDGTTRVRVLNAVPDAPPLDVTAVDSDETLFDGVRYATAQSGAFPAGLRTIAVTADGRAVAEFTSTFEGGVSFTVLVVGYLTPEDEVGDEPIDLVVVRDR